MEKGRKLIEDERRTRGWWVYTGTSSKKVEEFGRMRIGRWRRKNGVGEEWKRERSHGKRDSRKETAKTKGV